MMNIWMYSTISEDSSQVIKRIMRLFCYNVLIVTHLSWGCDHHCFFSRVHNQSVNLFWIFAIIFLSSRICVTECTFVLIFLVQYWKALVIWVSHFWHFSQAFSSWEDKLYAFQAYESRTEVDGCVCEGALGQELHLQRKMKWGGRQRRKGSESENWTGILGKGSEKAAQLFVLEDNTMFRVGRVGGLGKLRTPKAKMVAVSKVPWQPVMGYLNV